MPDRPIDLAGLRRGIERQLAADRVAAPAVGNRGRLDAGAGRRPAVSVEAGRAVIVCHAPRGAGAGVALGLADRVAARFRGRTLGPVRFDTPAIEIDGRDPAGFRAVVVLPFRRPGAA